MNCYEHHGCYTLSSIITALYIDKIYHFHQTLHPLGASATHFGIPTVAKHIEGCSTSVEIGPWDRTERDGVTTNFNPPSQKRNAAAGYLLLINAALTVNYSSLAIIFQKYGSAIFSIISTYAKCKK
ncbi:hypothetical protein BDA99DRAFT_537276 [Phascolomyces articulosus]|uniref:Uncharacterized protein n=1 Tax=Phascolomyces articulosus TaxID=60185 RepID=A0AAD5K087_9FUNG|nr:hypothetical protein BDA99DRAFT_537276 [Phascolomyces articulosus]